ncbi:MAG: glycosyltransferase family 4 protein [Chloroflexi bacterium]|nr:glycosyltransferase family 4 protein [Chloroflexota bacterium]
MLAPSVSTRQDLVSILGVPLNKVDVVPLAADARFVPQPAAEIERARAKYTLPPEYVLSVGINKPHKNLSALLDAWRQVDSPARLVIAGPWDTRYPLENQAGSAGVTFLHEVADADLPALYAGALLFVMPSLYEGFGLPALEAMACGVPVVCSNAASLPEVVGDAALLFDPTRVEEIAAALQRALAARALRDQLAARSRDRAAQFSWERAARETLRVYASVVDRL